MTFQLWEAESANLVGSYRTEDAALDVVRQARETHGDDAVASLVLLREDARGRLTKIADGATLTERALARSTPAA